MDPGLGRHLNVECDLADVCSNPRTQSILLRECEEVLSIIYRAKRDVLEDQESAVPRPVATDEGALPDLPLIPLC